MGIEQLCKGLTELCATVPLVSPALGSSSHAQPKSFCASSSSGPWQIVVWEAPPKNLHWCVQGLLSALMQIRKGYLFLAQLAETSLTDQNNIRNIIPEDQDVSIKVLPCTSPVSLLPLPQAGYNNRTSATRLPPTWNTIDHPEGMREDTFLSAHLRRNKQLLHRGLWDARHLLNH